MAQLKSTSVTGNLSVTGNVVASQIIKNDGTNNDILLGGGSTTSLNAITDSISAAQITASNARAYAENVYGSKANLKLEHSVLSNYEAITQLTTQHNNDKSALEGSITKLGEQHTQDIATLTQTHEEDVTSISNELDTKLNNFEDGEITGSLIATSFIKKDGTGDQTLLANGTTQHILQLAANVNEDSIKDKDNGGDPNSSHTHFYNAPILTGLTLGTDNTLTAQRRRLDELGINLVYNFKGSITGTNFRTLTNISVGDVYHITSQYPTSGTSPILAKGEDWVCHTAFTTAIENFNTTYTLYWSKLTNHIDLSGYLQKTGGRLNGSLQWYNAGTSPILKIGANTNSTILRITRTNGNIASLDDNQYGYSLIYNNSTSTTSNTLSLMCDNNTTTTTTTTGQTIGWRINQNGHMGIGMSPSSAYTLAIKESIYLGQNTSTLLAVKEDTVLSMDSDAYLTLQNKNQIKFLTSTDSNSKTTIYDVNGNWTMPNNLILNKGTSSDVYIELLRGPGADWKLLSSGDNFTIQCNYKNSDTTKAYYNVLTLNHNTGNMIIKGNINPTINNTQSQGSSSLKWKEIYATSFYGTNLNDRIDLSPSNAASMKSGVQLNAHYGLNWTSGSWTANGIITLSGATNNGDSWNFLIDDTTTSNNKLQISAKQNTKVLLECVAASTYKVNIPQGKLGLSSATFEYNSADKCIDVKFN